MIAAASGGSVRAAITQLVPVVATELSAGRPPAGPDGDEAQAMEVVHAPSLEAYRAYRAIIDDYDRSWWASGDIAAAKLTELSARHPHWLRPYMVLCAVHGRNPVLIGERFAEPRAVDGADIAGFRGVANGSWPDEPPCGVLYDRQPLAVLGPVHEDAGVRGCGRECLCG